MLKALAKGVRTISERLKTQGVRTTALWAYARGLPKLTGIPLLQYSRVTDALFVGPQFRENGKGTLARAGITHIVNMRSEFDDAKHGLTKGRCGTYHYCHLPTIDDEPISSPHIARGIQFIDSAIDSDGKVYIHCSAGVGRAPSMAAAYLISKGYCANDALESHKKGSPIYQNQLQSDQELRSLKKVEDNTGKKDKSRHQLFVG